MAQIDGVNQFANLRIALIEDEALVLMLLEDMLSELGCHVVETAAHLNDAIQLAGSTNADLAILDVNLDGQEAYAVAERLAARDIPFVFATGYGRQGLRAPFGNRPTLQKPFRIEDLRQAISEAIFGADHSRAGESGS